MPVEVIYEGQVVGKYFADLVVEDEIIVELKATKTIKDIDFAQCQNYLKATGMKLGLLISFGGERVQVRRLVNGF